MSQPNSGSRHAVGAVGFPWYRAEDFAELRAMFTDGYKLHTTYEGWRAAAELVESTFRQRGVRVVRALIEPAAFRAWCDARGLAMDAQARGLFANEAARDAARQDAGGTDGR